MPGSDGTCPANRQAGAHHQARAGGRATSAASRGRIQAVAAAARQRGPDGRRRLAGPAGGRDRRPRMTTPPLFDTHAWLWWLDGSGKLTAGERRTLDALAEDGRTPHLCAISLWEMALLVERERV